MRTIGSCRGRMLAALAAALLAGACAEDTGRGGAARPSLLLVSLDTVRADHTSLLGYPRPTTPNLEALAAQGVAFTRAYAMTSTTGPSHATLFTGRYAPAHGVVRNGLPLHASATTLAEHLQARGYRTAGILGSFVLAQRFGFAQGFERWDEDFARETSSLPLETWKGHAVPDAGFDRSGRETTQRAIEWLEQDGGEGPFALFVHYFDAHEPYTPDPRDLARLAPFPVEARSKDLVARYDAEIAGVDRELGRLLEALDALELADRTHVVVTSDHGQGLDDHDDAQHSVNIYEESVRAVLIFRGPGIAPGRTSDAPVEAVDVFPTLLDLVDRGSHRGLRLPGRSLARFLRSGTALDPERPVFLYRQHYPGPRVVRQAPVDGAQYGVRIGPWKYVEGDRDGRSELYDLSRDPGERENLADEAPERAAALRARLEAWRRAHPGPLGPPPEISADDRARLEALGYLE